MERNARHDSLVSTSVSTSETDILSDMIPYRCPKCGNKRRFAALRDLKLHLDVEHSFKMGCVKPRSRNEVFNHKLTKDTPSVTTGKYVKTKHGGKFSPKSSASEGSYGSMLKYYDDEAKILEMKVKMAKETEIKNKLNRNILHKSGGDNPKGIGMPRGDNLKQSFNNVNNQLLKSRHKEWKASEALYQAEDIIQGVEEAAENRCLDQQVVIRDLVNDLRQKESQLNRANNDLDKVRRERESLMLEVEELFTEANTGNTVLREELGRREHMLGDVNRQLDALRARARVDLDRKEDELIVAEGRVEDLEKERERLVQGTNTLLEQADKDRALLKETVHTKERQLHQVNRELDKLKTEQSDLVQKSVDLFEKANEGTARLKHLVQAKDNQLQEAFHELESMKNVHEKLIRQSKSLTEQADNNNQTLTDLLQSKEEELERAKQTLSEVKESNMAAFKTVLADKETELIQAKDELAKAKAEKVAMLESVKDLTQKASDQDVKMTELQNQVQQREQKLQEKERDLDSLKKFLSSAAEKEVVARSKLEQFISGLIDRADKAESELHIIKTRSMSEVDLSRSQTLGDVSDVMESDQENQRSSRNGQKVRARSQDSSLKLADYNTVQINSSPHEVTSIGQSANEDKARVRKPDSNTNVHPWQKILRKNYLSDSFNTDGSEMDIRNIESDLDRNTSEKHQTISQDDKPQLKNRYPKKAVSLDKSLLLHDQQTEMDSSKQMSHYKEQRGSGTKNRRHYDGETDGNYATDSGHLTDSMPNKTLHIRAEREDGIFYFGQANNENAEQHGVFGRTHQPQSINSKIHSVLPSTKSTVTERNFQQFTPQTSDVSKNISFPEFSRKQKNNQESFGIGMSTDHVTSLSGQTNLSMNHHHPPQQMVQGNMFARKKNMPRSKSESELKQTANSHRSLQLNQQLMDSYLSAQPVESNMQNYHHGNPFPGMVPEKCNVSASQSQHIDIPSFTNNISSSQKYSIRPFTKVTSQGNIQTDVSSSQRYPIGPFTKVTGQGNIETDVSSSQRYPIGPFTKVTGQGNIETVVSTSQGYPMGSFAKVTGQGNIETDVSSSQRYPIGPFTKVTSQGNIETVVSTSQGYPMGSFAKVTGQGNIETDVSSSQRYPIGPFTKVTGQGNIETVVSTSQGYPMGSFAKVTSQGNIETDVSSSQRYPIGPFTKVTGQGNIETVVSTSQGYPMQSFAKVIGQRNIETDVSSSQRYPIGPFTKVTGQGNIETVVSTSQGYPIGPFAKVTKVKGQGNIETDLSSSQRYPIRPCTKVTGVGNTETVVSTSQGYPIGSFANFTGQGNIETDFSTSQRSSGGQGHFCDIKEKRCYIIRPNVIPETQGHIVATTNVRPSQCHSVKIDGIQERQVQIAASDETEQSVQSESKPNGNPNNLLGYVKYIPVDTRTGHPVSLSQVKHSGSKQTPGVPVHHGARSMEFPPCGAEVIESGLTISPQTVHYSEGVLSPTLDQSQKLVTDLHRSEPKVDESSQSNLLTAEQKIKHQTSQAEPSIGCEVSRSSSYSVVDGNGDHDNSLSDVTSLVDYEHSVEEPEDIESATFEQFMDENGILWELSDTFKDQSVSDSLSQRGPGYTTEITLSNQMTSKLFTQQMDYEPQRRRQSEISGLPGKPVSRQEIQPRSKSAESIPHDRLSPGVRNRSMSPRVRFSDQKQYWPCSEEDNNHSSSSQRSHDPHYEENNIPKSWSSHSEIGILENSSSSVTDSKPDFEKLWLRDVSIGMTTPSVESFVPLQVRSSRPVLKEKINIRALGKKKDQGCQPLKDSSTQTWLLDCPLSLDDLGSVSQRSSFVRPQRSEYHINPLSVSSNEVKGANTDIPVGEAMTSENPPTQISPYTSNKQRYETQSSVLDSTPDIRGSSSSISEVKHHFSSQKPQDQSHLTSIAQKSEEEELSPEAYKPSHLSVKLCRGKESNRSILDSNEQSRDSDSSEKMCEETTRKRQSCDSKNGKKYRDYRSSNFQNIKDRKNGKFPDSKYTREDRLDQAQALTFKKGRGNGHSPDSTDSEFANDHNVHNDYLYRRERENGRSTNFRHSRDSRNQSPNSKYINCRSTNSNNRNDQSAVRDYRNTKQGRKNDRSPNVRYRKIDSDDYSDEYEDSQDDWRDDKEYNVRRKQFHKREKTTPNSYDDLDRGRKKNRSNYISSSRNDISSNSVSDSQDSVHTKASMRNSYSKIRSNKGATQSPSQEDLSMTTGNKHSDSLNTQLTVTDHDKHSASDLSAISISNEPIIHSNDSKTFSEAHISDQSKPEVDTEVMEPNTKDQISDKIEPVNVQYDSEYEKADHTSVEKYEGQKTGHKEDLEAEQMVVGNHVDVMDMDDQFSLYSIGSSSLSRTSSQESLLENIPKSRREAVRQRRLSLYLVFRYLDTKTLGRVAGVSREWKKVSRQSSLWKQVHLSHTRCTSKTLETLARWCTQLESLHLEDVYTRKQLELESDEDYSQAVRASLEAGVECLLQVSESTLKSVTIINCPHVLTDKCMWLASCYSRMLQNVCYHSNTHILGADVLWALGAGCGLIRSLDIAPLYPCANTEKFTNKCLQIISQFLPELDQLCIGGHQVDVNGFVLIAKSCQRLYSLSLHGCVDVVEDVAVAMCRKGLKNLRSLDFGHTPVTDKALLHFYSSCKHLKSIHVSFCLEDVITDPELKENTENFNKRIKALEKLKKKGGLWNILKLEVQKVED